MKKCIDKSNIKLESLSVPNGLNNLFFHINLKISSLEKVKIKNKEFLFHSLINFF